jgi:diaminohydroxyphosphoribosylaminopyrimidine deaminase / 5-amino-6-(5-phosphoribosylamino)uracil reductase
LLEETDRHYLERAMDLAENARGRTSPNPIVGAVIVRDHRILGEGFHVGPGRDHAEVAAIKAARARGETLAGTTIYVSLEPCCTFGRTPPCTDALKEAGFARVVVGAIDPSPGVNGKGVDILRAAGMQVEVADGDLNHRAKRQNSGVRKAMVLGLPFVTYKYALTLDGRVATDSGDSRWISSEESRTLVHQWRAWADAVVVGAGTMLADDPMLTARLVQSDRQPLRVVVDGGLKLRKESALVASVEEGRVLVVCGSDVPPGRRAEVEAWGVQTAVVALGTDGHPDPVAVGRCLAEREVREVLLEGGARLAGDWWAAGCVDKVAAFVCPRVAPGFVNRGALNGPGPVRMEDAFSLGEVELTRVGSDVLVTGYTGEPF